MPPCSNVFDLAGLLPAQSEIFEFLLEQPGLKIERIVSTGQTTPEGEWYDQLQHEWVVLLQGQAELTYSDGRIQTLQAGDFCWLPAHTPHRVSFTSEEPPCIWLAIHFNQTTGF